MVCILCDRSLANGARLRNGAVARYNIFIIIGLDIQLHLGNSPSLISLFSTQFHRSENYILNLSKMVLIKAEDSIVQAKEKPSKDAPLKNYQMKSDVPIENIPWLLSDSNPWVTVTLPDSVDPPPGINYDSLSSSYSAPSLCGRSVSTHSRSTGSEYIIDSPYDFQGGSITSPIPQRTKRQFSTLEPSSSKFSPHNNESDLLGLLQPEGKLS